MLLLLAVAAIPATITAATTAVPTTEVVAPVAAAPLAPGDAPPACAIALPKNIARKITASNLVMSPPKETKNANSMLRAH